MKFPPTAKTLIGIGSMKIYFAKIAFFLTLLIFCSCSHSTQTILGEQKMQTKHNEILLSMILNHPDLQPYLHPEAEGRLPVKVITTKEMGVNYLMEKYGMAVSFYSSKPKGSSNAFIQFESFIADDAECAFKISYQAEGIVAQGNIKKINNEWAFSKFSVIEQ